MAAIFYLGTVMFFVYVIYAVTYGDKKAVDASQDRTAVKPKVTAHEGKQEADKKTLATHGANVLVRNPETGETAAIPSNYRFAKRWIKESMVNEGLLEKVYSNLELDEDVSARVKEAFEQFRTLEKYRA